MWRDKFALFFKKPRESGIIDQRSGRRVAIDPRTTPSQCVIYDVDKCKYYDGALLDFSPGGMALKTEKQIGIGSLLLVSFIDDILDQQVSVYVRVVGLKSKGVKPGILAGPRDSFMRILFKRVYFFKIYRCQISADAPAPAGFTRLYERLLSDLHVKELLRERRKPWPVEKRSRFGFWGHANRLNFKIAETAAEREAAYRLVYREYLRRGFVSPNPYETYTCLYQLLPQTTTFIGTLSGEVVATMSSIADSGFGLAMDEIFSDSLQPLRKEGRQPVEFTMLAMKRGLFAKGVFSLKHYQKMAALFSLFRLAVQHAMRERMATDLVISINPCYQTLYKYLCFDSLGPLRYYERFNGNPALAMRLDLVRCTNPSAVARMRRLPLMRYFFHKRFAVSKIAVNGALKCQDLHYLFAEKSDLIERLGARDRERLSAQSPELKEWLLQESARPGHGS